MKPLSPQPSKSNVAYHILRETVDRNSGHPVRNSRSAGIPRSMKEPKLHFRSTVETESKEIIWEIVNFKTHLGLGKAVLPPRIRFDAGSTIGCTTKWSFFLHRNGPNLGLFLRIVYYRGPEREILVEYEALVRNSREGRRHIKMKTGVVNMMRTYDWGWESVASIADLMKFVDQDGTLLISFKFKLHVRKTELSAGEPLKLNSPD